MDEYGAKTKAAVISWGVPLLLIFAIKINLLIVQSNYISYFYFFLK
jgi:hypothetical protein